MTPGWWTVHFPPLSEVEKEDVRGAEEDESEAVESSENASLTTPKTNQRAEPERVEPERSCRSLALMKTSGRPRNQHARNSVVFCLCSFPPWLELLPVCTAVRFVACNARTVLVHGNSNLGRALHAGRLNFKPPTRQRRSHQPHCEKEGKVLVCLDGTYFYFSASQELSRSLLDEGRLQSMHIL